jgi:hypothetical protein
MAESCPNCGFPIAANSPNEREVDPVEPLAESMQTEGSDSEETVAEPEQGIEIQTVGLSANKKMAIIGISAIAVIAVVFAIVMLSINESKTTARNEYIDNLTSVRVEILSGAAASEEICNLTKKVWRNTIDKNWDAETYEYTHAHKELDKETFEYVYVEGKINEDFNDSLDALYSNEKTLGILGSIKNNQSTVDKYMKKLINPEKEFEECYAVLGELYDVYLAFTNLAISPSGSLTSYSQTFGEYDDQLINLYRKMELYIPEKS